MTVDLRLRQALRIDGCTRIGDVNVDQTLTGLTTGAAHSVEDVIVADNFGVKTLWATTQGGMTTYEKAFIFSTADIAVELRNTDTGTVEFALLFVRANELTALPAKVGANTTESIDGAALVENTDFANVDQIKVQRDAAENIGDATVSLFLFN